MNVGRPRKYNNRATVCVSIESKLKNVAQQMGIDFTHALAQGITFLIEYHLKNGEKIPISLLKEWKEVKESTLYDLKEYLKIEEDRQALLSDILEQRAESEARLEEEIEVWDDDLEKYRVIKRRNFYPGIHTIREKKAVARGVE